MSKKCERGLIDALREEARFLRQGDHAEESVGRGFARLSDRLARGVKEPRRGNSSRIVRAIEAEAERLEEFADQTSARIAESLRRIIEEAP